MCKKLEVSRSGFYAWAKRAPSEHCRRDQALLRLIAGRRYIERYKRTRIHSSLAYMSAIDYERTNA